MVHLANAAGDKATISLYGGQVLSWVAADGAERLYCSPQAVHAEGRAVRGGIPVCFPQFANRGKLPKHGFARTSHWQLDGATNTGCGKIVASAELVLKDSELSRAIWPHKFHLRLKASIGPGWLELKLQALNCGPDAFSFTAALHTYLAVANVQQAAVIGLERVRYVDSMRSKAAHDDQPLKLQNDVKLQITGEVDRIYTSAPAAVRLASVTGPVLDVVQTGFADTVVWNPGPMKAAMLGDMPATDWDQMLCIEAAQVMQPVLLQPSCSWAGSQQLTVCCR